MDDHFHKPNKSRRWVVYVLIALMILGLGLRIALALQDFDWLVKKVVLDDAFVSLSVARNLAEGNGLSFNGLELTNGFNVLQVFILAPLFYFSDDPVIPLRIFLLVVSLFNVLTAAIIFKIVKRYGDDYSGLFAAGLWLFNPVSIAISLDGIEPGLYGFFIAFSVYYYLKIKNSLKSKELILLGLLLGLTALTRMDGVILAGLIAIDIIRRLWKDKIIGFSRALLMGVAAIAVVLPWYVWSWVHFGTIRQSSSVAIPYKNIAGFLLANNTGFFSAVFFLREVKNLAISAAISLMTLGVGNLIPVGEIRHSYYTGTLGTVLFIGLVVALAGFFIFRHKIPLGKYMKNFYGLGFLWVFAALIILYYALFHWYLAMRYFYPVTLAMTIAIGILFYFFAKEILSRAGRFKTTLIILVVVLAVLGMVNTSIAFYSHGRNPWQIEMYHTALWMKNNIPEAARIGAFNSGIYSYFSGRYIVNLDGVVNWDVYYATKDRKLLRYLQENVDYVVDYKGFFKEYKEFYGGNFEDSFELVEEFPGTLRGGESILVYRRKGYWE